MKYSYQVSFVALRLITVGIFFSNFHVVIAIFKMNASLVAEKRVALTRDPVDNDLYAWKEAHPQREIARGDHGEPLPTLTSTIGVGTRGPLLLQDFNYQTHLASFTNERTPERVVHAKGAGAFGTFTVTNADISRYTKASLFSGIGKVTEVGVRFSTVFGNLGAADTLVDLRGFAVKFKTAEGNYDILMLNTLVFSLRDPILFPSVSRSRGRNARTHLISPDMYWDFAIKRPESTFNVFQIYSDLGHFKNYRHMSGHSVNSFKWTGGNASKDDIFVRYHMMSDQGKSIYSDTKYEKLAGTDPDHMIRDLYNSIARKQFPSFTLMIQAFTLSDVKKAKFNLFDPTKLLPENDFPMIPIGKMVLDRNPQDYFQEVEQIIFNPGNLIPGVEMSSDRLLHGRPFAYLHTHVHRIGINFNELPVNRPLPNVKFNSYRRDGMMSIDGNGDGGPNFFPNSFNGPQIAPGYKLSSTYVEAGNAGNYDLGLEDNFSQIDQYWREVMDPGDRKRTIKSLAAFLAKASTKIQEKSLSINWDPINPEISALMRAELAKAVAAREIEEVVDADNDALDTEKADNRQEEL